MCVGGTLRGFLILGRWPQDTVEWAQFLIVAVRTAAVPGMLPAGSTVFRVIEDLPDPAPYAAIGLVLIEGSLVGDDAIEPGRFGALPPALAVLHPPSESPGDRAGTASGCLFLPGLPHLGLDHRAAWVETDADGVVTRLTSKADLDPRADVDTAVLAALIAA
ncbi:peptidase [Propionicicella superfundia]|uniref:peptidase n=1 Tax=Propionicicella superfundia TaxID=348582 RepID=UPI001FE071DA|nr:peptidase [Propionicicella superfundia]